MSASLLREPRVGGEPGRAARSGVAAGLLLLCLAGVIAASPVRPADAPAQAPSLSPSPSPSPPAAAEPAPPVEPLSAADAPAYMRHLARELRVLLRDTPVELTNVGRETLRLTLPAGWLFKLDATTLRGDAQLRLDAVALALAGPDGQRTRLAITGHTDSLGRRELNETLTLQRADAVAQYFAARGVDATRLGTRGAGESELREKNEDSPAARQRNRRIEIELRPFRPSPREAS